jgi:hypothetical protein
MMGSSLDIQPCVSYKKSATAEKPGAKVIPLMLKLLPVDIFSHKSIFILSFNRSFGWELVDLHTDLPCLVLHAWSQFGGLSEEHFILVRGGLNSF